MTELNFTVYGNSNYEKMPTKSNDKTLEYTLTDFQALEMFSGIFGKFFFILSLEECLVLCNKLKVKIPEVFSQSKTISCKLTLLVFKIELARYLYANIADDEDIAGIESEVRMYMSNWVASRISHINENNEVARLNRIIKGGFYDAVMDIPISTINHKIGTEYSINDANSADITVINVQIWQYIMETLNNEPSSKVSKLSASISPAPPCASALGSNPVHNVNGKADDMITEETVSYSQMASTLKSPLIRNNDGSITFDFNNTDRLSYYKFKDKVLKTLTNEEDADESQWLKDHPAERIMLVNHYIFSKINLSRIHLSAGRSGTVMTTSHIHNMNSWPITSGKFLILTNLPIEIKNDRRFNKNIQNIITKVGVAVDLSNFNIVNYCSQIDFDDFGQPLSCILTLEIIAPIDWKCTSFCIEEQIARQYSSRIGVNICSQIPSCSTPNLIILVDGSSLLEAPIHQGKLREVLEAILQTDVHVILNPKHIHRPSLVGDKSASHNHMIFAVFAVSITDKSIEDCRNVLNINKQKTQLLTIDKRQFIIAKTFADLLEKPLPMSVVKSVPSAQIITNVAPTTSQDAFCNAISNKHAESELFIIPALPISPSSPVSFHIVLPPGEDKMIIDVGALPYHKDHQPKLHSINYACFATNVKGILIQHPTKYNPFRYATDSTKVISPLGHSSSAKK